MVMFWILLMIVCLSSTMIRSGSGVGVGVAPAGNTMIVFASALALVSTACGFSTTVTLGCTQGVSSGFAGCLGASGAFSSRSFAAWFRSSGSASSTVTAFSSPRSARRSARRRVRSFACCWRCSALCGVGCTMLPVAAGVVCPGAGVPAVGVTAAVGVSLVDGVSPGAGVSALGDGVAPAGRRSRRRSGMSVGTNGVASARGVASGDGVPPGGVARGVSPASAVGDGVAVDRGVVTGEGDSPGPVVARGVVTGEGD